jgi:protein O-GlcNAc transferase
MGTRDQGSDVGLPNKTGSHPVCFGSLIATVILFSPLLGARGHASQISPDNSASVDRQAKTAVTSRDWETAAASYEREIRLAPNNATLRVELGDALSRLNRLPGAIAAYREALRISPRNLSAEIGLARVYREVPNFEEGKRILEKSVREHPRTPEPLATLGDMEIQLQAYDSAISHLKAAVKLAPANVANRNLLAAAYKAKGDTDNAMVELKKVLARDRKNALALYLQAEIYSDQTRDDLALSGAGRVVELQPRNPRARVLLAKILLRTRPGESAPDTLKRCEQAVAALQLLPESETKSSETLYLLSRAYRCAGHTDEANRAVKAFEAASQVDRTTKESDIQSRHLVQEANDAALKNDRAQALDLAQQALAKNPRDGSAYSLMAKIYYSSGKIDDASAAIAKALERDPYHPDFLYVQGKILEKQGKFDEALGAFGRTTLINPKESDAYFEIGAIYQQRNDYPHAVAAYKKALELSPDDADYRRALASVSHALQPKR